MSPHIDLEDPFQVVEFVNEVLENGLKVIEIVPSTWVVVTGAKTGTCAYPDENDYDNLENLVQNLASPNTSWKKYDVEFLVTAGNYKQAQRRLKRLTKSRSDVESTDSEIESSLSFSKKKAAKTLKRTYNLLEDIPENEDDEENDRHDLNLSKNDNPISEIKPKRQRTAEPADFPESKAEKKKVLRDRLTELRETAENDSMKKFIVDYWDASMDLFTFKFRDDLANLKRAQQYELSRRVEELKVSVFANATLTRGNATKSPREELGTVFPIKDLESFLNFEKTLTPGQSDDSRKALEKQSSLKTFMKILTASSTDYATDIKIILKNLIDPLVQDLYSGAGRIVKGKGKKNFSATKTYNCMREFIEGKHKDSPVPLKILTVTSDWLAGSGERGGRGKERKLAGAAGR